MNEFTRRAFRDFWIGGVLSVLFDLDHVIPLVAKGLPPTFYNLGHESSRIGHFPIWFLVSGIFLAEFASFLRLWRERQQPADAHVYQVVRYND